MRGYFAIGIWHGKHAVNLGTLWRSAQGFGAAFVFTIGRRYKKQCSDTMAAVKHLPLLHFESLADLYAHLPYNCQLVGVELCETAGSLLSFEHPERCAYLLGAEDHGLSPETLGECHSIVRIPDVGSLNVAVAGSIVMFHRTWSRHQGQKEI